MLLVVQALSTNIMKEGSDSENKDEEIRASNCKEKEQIGIWSKSERANAVKGSEFKG